MQTIANRVKETTNANTYTSVQQLDWHYESHVRLVRALYVCVHFILAERIKQYNFT